LLRHGSDKTLQVGYANHFYRSAHKFEQICRHRLRRQNVGYSNFSQPQSHLSFCVLLQYLVERRRVVTQLGKLDYAGIQSATSRQNTKDQVYAQNEMLAYQQKESTARVASIMENTNLSKQQQVSEIMRQMLTQAQTAGQYFTNDQIKEMTRKVSAEVDLVHQQTQN